MHRLPGVWRLFSNGSTTVLTIPSDDRDRYHVLTNFSTELTLVVEIQALLSSRQLPSALTNLPFTLDIATALIKDPQKVRINHTVVITVVHR